MAEDEALQSDTLEHTLPTGLNSSSTMSRRGGQYKPPDQQATGTVPDKNHQVQNEAESSLD